MNSYIKLSIAALLPPLLAIVLYLLEKRTAFVKIKAPIRQGIYGVVFGILAIIGTEWGIPMNGAQVNCRDGAVLTAGLMFGAPAGIIAGIIGGVERWIAVAWGVGEFTRVACSVSTIIAGFYAAVLRKFMFENKKPGWLISLAIGVVMEVFHLTMVFLTNMATPERAMEVVRACTTPMVAANGLSVMLGAVAITLLSLEKGTKRHTQARISQTIQRWLLVTVVLAFLATSYFVFALQERIADEQTDSLLDLALQDVSADISDASDRNMLLLTHEVADYMNENPSVDIRAVEKHFKEVEGVGFAEINLINEDGIIVDSTVPEYINYNMKTGGEQSRSFMEEMEKPEITEYVQEYGSISHNLDISRKYAGVKFTDGNGVLKEIVQLGYDAESFQKDIDTEVVGITKNRHVGKTGYILIVDEDGGLVSAPAGLTKEKLQEAASGIGQPEMGVTFTITADGETSYCRFQSIEGYSIVSVLPDDEALQMRNIALYVNTFMEILVFAVLFALIYLLIKRVVVNQIKSINRSLARITKGDLGVVVDVRTNEEFASLSDDINSTVDTLKQYISEASARIDKELEFAKSIQSSALPSVFPAFPKRKDFDIYALMDPAKEVGGDFYDFYMTGDTLHFLVADVSGKGIPAAMFMMRAKTELKTLTEAGISLDSVFTDGNHALCEGNDAGMFVTAWQGSIDLQTGLVRYVNAGHNPPLVRHADGKFEYLRSRVGFVLAGMDGVKYKIQELQLEPGDIVYLYTDGVTEATDANNVLYGEERLLNAISAREYADMKDLCVSVKADVDAFVGTAPQFDDITMVALHYFGTKPAPSITLDEAKLDDIPAVTEFVESELEKLDCPMKTVIQINIAIDELFSNIVRYGYPDKAGPVTVTVIEKEDPHTVCIQFCDEGIPYNPLTKEDPDITLSAEDRKIGGLGIFMVKKSMDDMRYKYENGQNILTIYKKLE